MTCRFDLYWIDDFHSPSFVWEKLFASLASPVGFISIFGAAGIFLFYLFKIMASCFNRCRIADFHGSCCVWEKLFAGVTLPVCFISIFCAAGIFLFCLFKIMTCSRDRLGVGVTAVILADIGTNAVCSAGRFDSHGAFVSMSTWIGCPTANCTSLSACASCRSTPIMLRAWLRNKRTTFLAITRPLMKLRV